MGTGIRVHFFNDDGSINRIPHAKFDRLIGGDSDERLDRCAGKRVKCAMSFLKVERRKVLRISRMDFMIIPFASDGRVDQNEWFRMLSLVVNSTEFLGFDPKVRSLKQKSSQKKLKQEFLWTPTEKEINQLHNDIFS